jgi:hypothetical protein
MALIPSSNFDGCTAGRSDGFSRYDTADEVIEYPGRMLFNALCDANYTIIE